MPKRINQFDRYSVYINTHIPMHTHAYQAGLRWGNCTKLRNTLSSSIFACLRFQLLIRVRVLNRTLVSNSTVLGDLRTRAPAKKLSLPFRARRDQLLTSASQRQQANTRSSRTDRRYLQRPRPHRHGAPSERSGSFICLLFGWCGGRWTLSPASPSLAVSAYATGSLRRSCSAARPARRAKATEGNALPRPPGGRVPLPPWGETEAPRGRFRPWPGSGPRRAQRLPPRPGPGPEAGTGGGGCGPAAPGSH